MGFFGFGKKNKEKEQEKMKTGLSAWEQSIEIPLTVSDCTTG